ncbi:hypothetical protein [Bacillus sp. Bva_UNVM-123]
MISFSTLIVSILALSYTFSKKSKTPLSADTLRRFTVLNVADCL